VRLLRPLTLTLAIAALSAVVASLAAAETLRPSARARVAAVQVLSCSPDEHQALFRGSMRRVPRTRRMSMRFVLLERTPGRRWARVRARGLTRWKRSRPGVRRFAHRQRVRGLRDGLEYRARVDFRWHDSAGRTIRRRRGLSRVCSLAPPLPDLRVAAVTRAPEGAGDRYRITVENQGRGTADPTDVRLAVDGGAPQSTGVPALAPGQTAVVELVGPRCGFRVRAVADPFGRVVESREHNNGLLSGCP